MKTKLISGNATEFLVEQNDHTHDKWVKTIEKSVPSRKSARKALKKPWKSIWQQKKKKCFFRRNVDGLGNKLVVEIAYTEHYSVNNEEQ